jgi:16S rRNA (uracil1498-N3)-methyltransferase
MSAERYYVDSEIKINDLLSIEDQEFRHMALVMRTKQGEKVEIINGRGVLAEATVQQLAKKQAVIKVEAILEGSSNHHSIILAQAIPRINRLDFIIEKGTELGMTDIWLFPGVLSERQSLTDHQLDRLRGLSIAAMKQCNRLWLPRITKRSSLQDWKPFEYDAYYGDLSPSAPLFFDHLTHQTLKKPLVFFVGPESGFTQEEQKNLMKLGAKGVKLHQNILRTDTAAIAALSLMTCHLNHLS